MRRFGAVTTEITLLLCGLTLIAIAATYPLIRHLTTHLPNDVGDPVLVAWTLGWDAEAFRHGITRVFDAPNFFPYPYTLAYSDHLLGLAMFTAPLQWLSANPVLTYNVAFIASSVFSGAAMYLLARTLTGRRDAAVLAALAYGFSPFRVAHIAHLQWLTTGWLPLGLWALHRYFATGALRLLLAAAAAYLLQSLTASYFTYFALLPLAAVAGVEMWRSRPPLGRTLAHLLAAGALVALILAPIVVIYYRARVDHDFVRKPVEIAALSADLSDYFRGHHYIVWWRHARHGTSEHELFPGMVVLALAGAALTLPRRDTPTRVPLYAAIAAAAVLLSFGPHPSAWGHVLPIPGPYQLLVSTVPGLDGLRSVSRLGIIVVLAVGVLGAFGAARLLAAAPVGKRPWLVAALAIGIVADSWAAPIPVARFNPLADRDDRDTYAFLKTAGPEGAVLELPMGVADDPRELRYQYLTLSHGHRIVNGSSSYAPALTQLLASPDQSPFSDTGRLEAAIGLIRSIGVRYVVVHQDSFTDPAGGTALVTALEHDPAQTAAEYRFGRTIVVTLVPADRPAAEPSTAIPAASVRASVSHSPDRLPLLFDRDRDSRWLTGEPQRGREWIELALDGPRDVSAVRLQTAERSFGDYPRELAVDVVEAGGTRTLFHGSVLPLFGRALTADLSYPTIEIRLPENQARAIRLRQLGTTDRLFWSIHELELRERTR